MTKTLSEQMLPNPHITEAPEVVDAIPELEESYLHSLNAEAKLQVQGLDPRVLPMASQTVRAAELARQTVTDPMTGLLNRHGMEMWMERNRPEVFGVVFADGRNFKQYNNISYDAGNTVIEQIGSEVAGKLRIGEPDEATREKRQDPEARDALGIMRFGGDEFMIVLDLTSVNPEEREAVLARIKDRLTNFGHYKDKGKGIDLPIQVDSAAKVGYRDEDKSLDDYRRELEAELKLVKAKSR